MGVHPKDPKKSKNESSPGLGVTLNFLCVPLLGTHETFPSLAVAGLNLL